MTGEQVRFLVGQRLRLEARLKELGLTPVKRQPWEDHYIYNNSLLEQIELEEERLAKK